ncbi:MAG TPA: alcohol dehydrogenase catalytic domain-containing protein, partial [Chitinophaga sp.]
MIAARGHAAQSETPDLAPWHFERREAGAEDILIAIAYCGVCHADLHAIKNEWFPRDFPYGARAIGWRINGTFAWARRRRLTSAR